MKLGCCRKFKRPSPQRERQHGKPVANCWLRYSQKWRGARAKPVTPAQHFDHNHKKLMSMIRERQEELDKEKSELDALQATPTTRPETRVER